MRCMIRKQIYIEERQEALLKRLAKTFRTTEAELIRRSLDRGLTQVQGVISAAAWDRALEIMERRRRPGKIRRWRREDLYNRD